MEERGSYKWGRGTSIRGEPISPDGHGMTQQNESITIAQRYLRAIVKKLVYCRKLNDG